MVKLDETLSLFQDLIQEMARKVRSMHCLAMQIMESGDKEKALQLIQLDEFVNRYEEEINDRAQDVLALLSPVATDLRIVIAGIKTASDLERIADYAKNIARYVIKNGPVAPCIRPIAQQIGESFLAMFDHTIEAYQARDVKKAFQIPEEDEVINRLLEEVHAILKEALKNQKIDDSIIPTVGLLRNLERAGDHTKNICEHLIYQEKGQHIDFD